MHELTICVSLIRLLEKQSNQRIAVAQPFGLNRYNVDVDAIFFEKLSEKRRRT